jgi:hypothetical protein
MSALLGQSNNSACLGLGTCVPTDDRSAMSTWQWSWKPSRQAQAFFEEGALWTSSTGLGGAISGGSGLFQDAGVEVSRWEHWLGYGWDDTGGQKQNVIVGQTLDQNGNALGFANVEAFLTSSNQPVGSVQSDGQGYFRLPTPWGTSVTHYLVCYLSGSPDIAGTSVNTLTPTITG